MTDTDWRAWSRDAVRLMKSRNADWPGRYGIEGAPYRWDLETGTHSSGPLPKPKPGTDPIRRQVVWFFTGGRRR